MSSSAAPSSLEHSPPIPILQPGPHPLHKFLGFLPRKHIVMMALRDPFDAREMSSNGNNFVTAYCIRGVRQVPHFMLHPILSSI